MTELTFPFTNVNFLTIASSPLKIHLTISVLLYAMIYLVYSWGQRPNQSFLTRMINYSS